MTELASAPRRDGSTYDHERDGKRLAAQHGRIFDVMKDGRWRTLSAIALATGDPEASISARLRDLRKPKFGAHTVSREYLGDGLFQYRLLLNRTDLFE